MTCTEDSCVPVSKLFTRTAIIIATLWTWLATWITCGFILR